MFEPHLIDGEGDQKKSIPLSQCNQEQTERLLDQLLSKMTVVSNFPNPDLYVQIESYLQMVNDRLQAFDDGTIKKPQIKEKGFTGLKIIDDE